MKNNNQNVRIPLYSVMHNHSGIGSMGTIEEMGKELMNVYKRNEKRVLEMMAEAEELQIP